jgi:hypothetical protein
MITSTTPYKLAEIIRDTWPQLYRPTPPLNNQESKLNNEIEQSTRNTLHS